jgi:hypothetical protein
MSRSDTPLSAAMVNRLVTMTVQERGTLKEFFSLDSTGRYNALIRIIKALNTARMLEVSGGRAVFEKEKTDD